MKIKVILILSIGLTVISCQLKPEDSPALREARETYFRMMEIASESKAIADQEFAELRVKADSLIAKGDSILALKLHSFNTKLDSLKEELESLRKQAEEMKAHSALHEEGDEHVHHDHSHSVDYTKFSDEQLLEFQVELEKQVQHLQEEMKTIQKELKEHVDTPQTQP